MKIKRKHNPCAPLFNATSCARSIRPRPRMLPGDKLEEKKKHTTKTASVETKTTHRRAWCAVAVWCFKQTARTEKQLRGQKKNTHTMRAVLPCAVCGISCVYLKAGSCWPPPKSVKNMRAMIPTKVTRFIGLPSAYEEE